LDCWYAGEYMADVGVREASGLKIQTGTGSGGDERRGDETLILMYTKGGDGGSACRVWGCAGGEARHDRTAFCT